MLKLYKEPTKVGWMGWFEAPDGTALAYITLEGRIVLPPPSSDVPETTIPRAPGS